MSASSPIKNNDEILAFPQNKFSDGSWFQVGGMTLRDWFAGQALNGMLADPNGPWDGAAEKAYFHADRMIIERNKP